MRRDGLPLLWSEGGCKPGASSIESANRRSMAPIRIAWGDSRLSMLRVSLCHLQVVPFTANDVGTALVLLFQVPMKPTPV